MFQNDINPLFIFKCNYSVLKTFLLCLKMLGSSENTPPDSAFTVYSNSCNNLFCCLFLAPLLSFLCKGIPKTGLDAKKRYQKKNARIKAKKRELYMNCRTQNSKIRDYQTSLLSSIQHFKKNY